MSTLAVTPDDIGAAAARIVGVAHRTPVARSRTLDERLGAQAFLKCENLQRVGAFKIRGAYNAIVRLSAQERRRGVLAFSSGNHAQAVALASRLLEAPATIVMPGSAPAAKLAATKGYGARVVTYDPLTEDREEIARKLQEETGAVLVPPYDHADVIAGQGTAGLELLAETGPLDVILVPCGGGGLLAGTCLAALSTPGCRVIGVEPSAGDDGRRSFHSGTLQTVKNPDTIADGARTPSLGRLTFPIIQAHAHDIVTVTDEQIVETLRFVWERMKLVVEPTGVLGLAAALHGVVAVKGQRVGAILTGGNVDLAAISRMLGH